MKIFYFFILIFCSLNSFSNNIADSVIGYETYGNVDEFLFFKDKDYEILYFYSYSCPACYQFSTVFNKWVKTVDNKKIGIKKVPVVFKEHWLYTSKINFISNALKIENIEEEIYKYIHLEKKHIFSNDDILLFFLETYGIEKNKIEPYLENPILLNAVNQGTLIADKFDIPATPYFVVIDKEGNVYRLSHRISKSNLGLISSLKYLTEPNFKEIFNSNIKEEK